MNEWYEQGGYGLEEVERPSRTLESILVAVAVVLEIVALVLIALRGSTPLIVLAYVLGCLLPLLAISYVRRVHDKAAAQFGSMASAGSQNALMAIAAAALLIAAFGAYTIASRV